MKRKIVLITVGALFGAFLLIQSRSFKSVADIISRDMSANVFREIQILKQTNEDLRHGIEELSENLEQTKNRATALQAIEKEIANNKLLSGSSAVQGPGLRIEIKDEVRAIWLVDFTNELLNAGAEAVSVNNIRLTEQTRGFDTLPLGQILLNGSILIPPYVIQAIGEPNTLKNALLQAKGIVDRYVESGRSGISLEIVELGRMEKVL